VGVEHFRSEARRYDAAGRHVGPGEWLDFIHVANGVAPGTFGAPVSSGPWWAGGSVEEYADARVLHREDGSVSVVSTTEHGAVVLAEARRRFASMELVDVGEGSDTAGSDDGSAQMSRGGRR
jgi:hypothetical protein